jgi:hypothetical protein
LHSCQATELYRLSRVTFLLSLAQNLFWEPVRVILRCEEKEMPADARPQARKNRRRIRWNTLRIFRAENDADVRTSFAAVERHYSDRLLWSSCAELPLSTVLARIEVVLLPDEPRKETACFRVRKLLWSQRRGIHPSCCHGYRTRMDIVWFDALGYDPW